MPRATGDDLVKRYDIDLIGDLATDERETLDRDDVPTHPRVIAALEDADGEIEAALLAGGRYTIADLNGLSGNALSHYKRISCSIAMAFLFEARPGMRPEVAEAIAKQSREHVQALRRGENVFGIPAVTSSGILEYATVSVSTIENRNTLPDRMPRFFPGANQRHPRG
jgi:phage gp36-like protein